METEMRDGSRVRDPRLGRFIEFDERSRSYSLFESVPPDGGIDLRKREIVSRVWTTGKKNEQLDQGILGACALITLGNALNYERGIQHRTSKWCLDAYQAVQEEDEFPGSTEAEGGPGGTSLLAVLKWAKKNGLIVGYKFAFSLEEALIGAAYYGPPLFGSMWTYDMVNPERSGLCRPTGRDMGGHAVAGNRIDIRTKRISGPNWPFWNKNGFWEMTFDDFEDRLYADGECAFIIK